MVRAIQAMVSPATLRELKSRATGGNTMENVLETTLLNNLQLIDPGTQGAHIIAIDFTRQVVVAAAAFHGLAVLSLRVPVNLNQRQFAARI
jgi:hypothetical protein